ncbi:peroxiredoxin [Wenjunlia tyrosinilytica]|jgi:peroxiredoxin Q/BCP|uniref:thioredoxin-dependent peroxiredoxin n=1 Tax=Wenjunlia tyrosinilytica TaxID=1544741 RepID=A0A917ZQF2_9ACTN|nr:peroxiredoxin [Wenjunlia tyrosinilytica]GGO87706.1 peroxiredoxin [Wenjunlia tyrosinilytica]
MAKAPRLGERLPDFNLPGGRLIEGTFARRDYTLSGSRGRPVVLAFYPGDNTTVCTKQLCSYMSGFERFTELGAEVWGISPQGVDSHEEFARRHGLSFPLLADEDRSVARAFAVAAPGTGLRRAVFVVSPAGELHWKHVALLGVTFQSVDTIAEQLGALTAN